MANVKVYSRAWCPFCTRAKSLLNSKGIKFKVIDIEGKPALREEMIALTGRTTVPQIIINNKPIGGCDDLMALDAQGKLDTLLNL